MRIAILMCNTDRSAFADRHPKDAEKWPALLAPLRPDWRFESFDATAGDLPAAPEGIDGAIVTGSPASVRGGAPWVAALEDTIRRFAASGTPLFGACFGHQAIARALGGEVDDNPGGFVLGNVETRVVAAAPWMPDAPSSFRIAAAHGEQVTALPPDARILTRSDDCPVGGFAIGDRVFTTEYHPEIDPGFLAALIDELDGRQPAEVIARARASLDPPADRALFAGWIVRFLERRGG